MTFSMLGRIGAAVVVMATLAGPVAAQTPAGARRAPDMAPQVEAGKLMNLARVHRQLQRTIERERLQGATLRYNIDVFARAPRIELFAPDVDLQFGPVPFSAPTHQDMLNIVTPQEFRSPIMNFNNLFNWLQKRSGDKNSGR
jgi:hypothetical protein